MRLPKIHESMQYLLLADGKRVRSLLCLAVCFWYATELVDASGGVQWLEEEDEDVYRASMKLLTVKTETI
ncbi:unnamed protein product [Linum trigynum]|uniref:Ig-like domain-containing protein n=1 Tax=Linum trigynum TaxID=586398 RepID=A0AAV2ED10_9ROSI